MISADSMSSSSTSLKIGKDGVGGVSSSESLSEQTEGRSHSAFEVERVQSEGNASSSSEDAEEQMLSSESRTITEDRFHSAVEAEMVQDEGDASLIPVGAEASDNS